MGVDPNFPYFSLGKREWKRKHRGKQRIKHKEGEKGEKEKEQEI